jgi:putative ABC transport system permease protein
MIKNYFLIGFRNLLRNKGYATLNIAGLAIGIAACLLIFTVVQFELSYDTFQSKYDRIYRVVMEDKYNSGDVGYTPGIPTPAAEVLRLDLPQVSAVAAINTLYGNQVTVLGENPEVAFSSKKFIEPIGVFFMEPQFFQLFDAKWLAGNPDIALKEPNTVALDKTQARKYFGDWKQAVGQYLKLDNNLVLQVKGVIEDVPVNSDFPLKVMISYETFKKNPDIYGYSTDWNTISSNHQVFLLLPDQQALPGVQAALQKVSKKQYDGVGNTKRVHMAQPLSDIHFNTRYGNLGDHLTSKSTLLTLSFIGVLILIMACINFVNLATAQALSRSKEVGVRKVLGGNRMQLMGQFLGETTLIVCVAVVLAVVIAQFALPYLTKVSNVPEGIPFLNNPYVIVFLVVITAVVSFLSGMYPALVLSGFEPIQALKTQITARNIGGVPLRRSLVVVQFAISQILIIGTLIALGQMNYIQRMDLGFRKEAVYIVPMSNDSLSRMQFTAFKSQLAQNPAIQSVTLANDAPSSDNRWGRNFYFDHSTENRDFSTSMKYADPDYFRTYGMEFVAGNSYPDGDTAQAYVVNETFLRKLGVKNMQEAIGKTVRLGGRGPWLPIVGVVKDFKTSSVRDPLQPIVFAPDKANYYQAGIKIRSRNVPATVAEIKALWEKSFPAYVYNGSFFDESIDRFYRQESQLALTYQIFAGLAIFISCLGLYGLVSFMAVQKTKEIGIRKVLGASITDIVGLLSKEFLLLITLAFVLATPVAYYMMNNWLQNFEFRIPFSASSFLITLGVSLLIALLTVGYRAIRAALANPVKSLRTE